MTKHLDIRLDGKVQGVFFRQAAKDKADILGLEGFARNEADGSVWIEVEGETEELDVFAEWCTAGPPGAKVETAQVVEAALENYTGFTII